MSHNFEDIISLENLFCAWEEFIRGRRNNPHVQVFACRLIDNIIALHNDLANRIYRHGRYKERHLWDPKHRLIHVASVRDRVLHHAIYRVLYPFFDRTFIGDSYSCRIDKGTHRAINRFRTMAYKVSRNHTRTCWVLKCDIKKFFASIDHEVLLQLLRGYIPDQDVMWLLGQVVKSFCTGVCGSPIAVEDDTVRRVGLPLGNLTSQLFSNIYMNELDRFAKHTLQAKYYIRYADDFVFLHEDQKWLENQILIIRKFLQERSHLQLHPNKVTIGTFASGVDFLGWVHFTDHRVLRNATSRRMMRKIKERPTPETAQSYLGLLSHGNTFNVAQEVRMQHWFQTY